MFPRNAMISPLLLPRARNASPTDVSLSSLVVLGQPWQLAPHRSAAPGATRAEVTFTSGVTIKNGGARVTSGDVLELASRPVLSLDGRAPSAAVDAETVTLTFKAGRGGPLSRIVLQLAFVQLNLLCDADRDGKLDDEPSPPTWAWGEKGRGPIVLVNNDRDVSRRGGPRRDRLDSRAGGPLDLQDMAPLAIAADGPRELGSRYRLVLQVSDSAAEKVRVFDCSGAIPRALIEPGKPRASLAYMPGKRDLRVEGLQYPDGLGECSCARSRNVTRTTPRP